MPYRAFNTFWEAFEFCREMGYPVMVVVRGQLYKLFPSGKALRMPSRTPPAGA